MAVIINNKISFVLVFAKVVTENFKNVYFGLLSYVLFHTSDKFN